jgi:excisionase family DNA binding protein
VLGQDAGRILTPSEVAELLRVPESWVYRAAREGRLPCIRLGRYVRFGEHELERWLDERRGVGRP